MRKILTYIFIVIFCLSVAVGQSSNRQKEVSPQASRPDARSVEKQILNIEKKWSEAFIKRDPTVFQQHVADDYIGIYPTRNLTKADLIASVKNGRSVETVSGPKPKVRVYDKTAVVTGHAVYHIRENSGEKLIVRTLYTEVFVLKDGVWQCVSGHYTPQASPE